VRLRLVEAAKGGEVRVGLVDARPLEGVHPVRDEGHDARGRLAVRLPVVADEHRLRLPAAARRLGRRQAREIGSAERMPYFRAA
jgi:hypothetical protein